MRIKLFATALIILLLIPVVSRAVDQETMDRYIFLLQQPEWNFWGDGVFNDNTLLEGLDQIYVQAVTDGDDILVRRVVWAMGETTLTGFTPSVIATLETEPVVACYALGKLSSVESVAALIVMLDDDDMQVRDAAVWGLGNITYGDGMEEIRDDAVDALNARLETEEEDWVREDIQAAVTLIETGLISSEIFMEPTDSF